jgi:hypothetical protein
VLGLLARDGRITSAGPYRGYESRSGRKRAILAIL